MQFESVKNNDLEEIRKLKPDGWPDIIPDFEFYINSAFCYPIKAVEIKKIVGVGVSIIFYNTSWLAHIIVDKNFRNRGIGYKIVNKLLENLKNESIVSYSLLATDLGRPIYIKAGFRDVTEYCFLKKESIWKDKPFSTNVIPFREEHRSEIYNLDKIISGENREKLLAPFLKTALVYFDNKIVTGYFIPDLKEGLIFAENANAGFELMKIKYSKADKAVLPSGNITGIDFLKQNGFMETGIKGTRMVLGKDIDWKPDKIYSRIGGNFG